MSGLAEMFQHYKNNKLAIYGLGTETEKALEELGTGFQVVGLLDGYREDGLLYGKPIIPLSQAVESGIKWILVVARPGSCKAIAKRIGKICAEKQIDLIDVRGKDLCAEKKAVYHFKGVDGITKAKLVQLVTAHDVVSIDLFDTLVMRQTLFPTDVFEIVNYRLREKGIVIDGFCGKRLDSEKTLSQITAPTLTEIYHYMIDTYSIGNIKAEELVQLEYSVDYGLILPRQEVCELISEIYNQGKEVYIVSDTYYTKQQIEQILEKCGIYFYTDILASCEYKESKTGQLFHKLKEKISDKSCLHIGDDIVADIESANRNQITACRIYNGAELLEKAGYLGLWDSINDLSDRIRVGLFVSRLFNSPFQFETGERRICIQNAYDIGYLLFAPIISDFVFWFDTQVKDYKLQNIWFCARDGFLIKKLYDTWNKDNRSVYFLTSRTAAIRAGVESEDDIEYVAGMKFSGPLQKQLQERFGIQIPDGNVDGSLLDYKEEILEKAFVDRKNYMEYIRGLEIKRGDVAFFDFVAKGTSQMYIGRLVENHLKGLYFLQLEEDGMKEKGLDIIPFYQKGEMDDSAIFDDYYILETMLTAPEPSVREFGRMGEPCYAKETRTEEDIQCFLAVQNGVLDYFKTYLGICPGNAVSINKKLDEIMLSLIHGVSVLDRAFLDLKVEDSFFNRMTDMMDLI